jgi:hypothetical protein
MSIADKLTQIAENEQKVYEAGKKAEYDKFWDAYQHSGNRTSYANGFTGTGFDFANFYPKYDIKPTGSAIQLFYAWEYVDRHGGNLAQRLKDCGVVLDTSQATNLSSCFAYGRFTELPAIDCSGLSTSSQSAQVFAHCYERLRKIEKIISKEGITFNNWFINTNVEEVIFEGVIGGSGLDMKYCKRLNKASITSIINALSSTTTGLTVVLSKTAVNNAFTTEEWDALKATKSNWNIDLQ